MAVPVASLLRSSSKGAITVAQFTDTLQRTWTESRRFRPGTAALLPRRFGLAVSGGADSMALAYLCREWEKQQLFQSQRHTLHRNIYGTNQSEKDDMNVSVTAFVVDHKARVESTQEARSVVSWLQDLGLKTSILPLTWPQDSLTSSAFETHARRLRYRALGEACRERGIEALLMGHHQDDNVETTIWRLASGAKGAAGLTGIPGLARIPECHGLWGVAESGRGVFVSPDDFVLGAVSGQLEGSQIQVAIGGIYISRPLLSFPKSSLVATCVENGVPFVDDPTNFDPTLTPRNAIRSMLSKKSLPRALTNPSILSLIERAQGRVSESYRLSDEILEKGCRLLDVNFRSGMMTVQFCPLALNSLSAKAQEDQGKDQEDSPQLLKEVHALALRRLTEFISPFPENHWPLSGFAEFIARVFPPSSASSKLDAERKAFTVGGVLFQPLPSSSPSISSSKTGAKTTTNTAPTNEDPTTTTTLSNATANKWLLTRQPYFRNRAPTLRLNLPLFLTNPPTNQPDYTSWILWDNRFWIRAAVVPIHSHSGLAPDHGYKTTEIPIVIRPLQQSDLSFVRQVDVARKQAAASRETGQQNDVEFDTRAFFAKLSSEAPSHSRFTVPVLALADPKGKDKPLVLPTMDLLFPDPDMEPKAWTIRWEWKYKMVDFDSLKLMGLV
ncbi:PP-loop family-domain-containing protein [Aspergillus granulosus]|uniref:tRNA(Ile)-lysidine synthetase n=1 Tax=Aspergillus granulosus TaxID=176169 RepID=A0ABR4I1V5_9EURO